MLAPNTTAGALPAHSVSDAPTGRRRRRRTASRRMTQAARDYAGTGVFLAMLTVCVTLIVLSR